MKYMAILAAAMLALGPAIASADPASTASYERPAPGPVASQTDGDDNFDTSELLLFGGTFVLGGVLLALLAGDGDDTTTTTTTATTTTAATTTN